MKCPRCGAADPTPLKKGGYFCEECDTKIAPTTTPPTMAPTKTMALPAASPTALDLPPAKTHAGANEDADPALRPDRTRKLCPACGDGNEMDVRYCVSCGADFTAEVAAPGACAACGTQNPTASRFCLDCGCELRRS